MSPAREQHQASSVPATRERILAIAARLFAEQGYDQTSLAQVGRETGVSKALVLWHFDTKDELFRAAIGRTIEPYFIDTEDLAGLDEPHQIERLIDQFYEFVDENAYSVRFFLSLILREDKQQNETISRVSELYAVFRGLLERAIDTGRRNGVFRADLNPNLDAALILASLAGILVEHLMAGRSDRGSPDLLDYLKQTTISRLLA